MLAISNMNYSTSFRKSLVAALGGVTTIPVLLVRKLGLKKVELPQITEGALTARLRPHRKAEAGDSREERALQHPTGLPSKRPCGFGNFTPLFLKPVLHRTGLGSAGFYSFMDL